MSLTIIGASSQRSVQTNVANTWTATQSFAAISCTTLTASGNITGSAASVHRYRSYSGATLIGFGSVEDSSGYFGSESNHPISIVTNSITALTISTSQAATFASSVACTALTASGQVNGGTVLATTSYQVNNGGIAAIGQILQDGAYFGIVADSGNPTGLRLSAPGTGQSIVARVEGIDRLTITAASGAVFTTPISCTALTAPYTAGQSQVRSGSIEMQSLASVNNAWIGENSYFDGTAVRYRATGRASGLRLDDGSGNIVLWNAVSGSAGATPTLVNQLTIASTGAATFASSVSCAGLTSTVAGVAATFDSGAASDARMEFKRNGVRQGLFSWDTSALRFEGDATASSAIYFKAGGGDRLTIASGGTVTVTSTNDGSLTCAGRITAKVAVPGSFADLAAVQSYLVSILT